jgi:hypothetical protein
MSKVTWWREYTIRLPKHVADAVDAALSDQQQMEDREIETSEFWCYLLTLGLQHLAVLKGKDAQADRRIISP